MGLPEHPRLRPWAEGSHFSGVAMSPLLQDLGPPCLSRMEETHPVALRGTVEAWQGGGPRHGGPRSHGSEPSSLTHHLQLDLGTGCFPLHCSQAAGEGPPHHTAPVQSLLRGALKSRHCTAHRRQLDPSLEEPLQLLPSEEEKRGVFTGNS